MRTFVKEEECATINFFASADLDILAFFAANFDAAAVTASLRHWFDHELCRQLHEKELWR